MMNMLHYNIGKTTPRN